MENILGLVALACGLIVGLGCNGCINWNRSDGWQVS